MTLKKQSLGRKEGRTGGRGLEQRVLLMYLLLYSTIQICDPLHVQRHIVVQRSEQEQPIFQDY